MKTRQPDGKRAARDERGRFGKGNQLGPGRPKGSKDKYPRAGSIKAIYESLIATGNGFEKMRTALDKGLKEGGRVGLGYMELGAKLFDKVEEGTGKVVHFHLHTNVDFTKLDDLARKNGMIPPLAGRS